jgi:plastocyanin
MRAAAAALALLALAACAPRPKAHRVAIRGFAYVPAALTVAVGDTIVWTNEDVVPHTATADGAWDTGSLANRGEAHVVVAAAGETAYRCAFHPTMTARVSAK